MAAASAPQLAGASGRPMRMLCSTRVWKSSSASSTVSVIARFGPSLAELAGRSTTSSGCRLKTRKSVAACDALSPRAQSIPKAQKLVIPHAFGPRREPWTVPRPRPRPSSKIRFVSIKLPRFGAVALLVEPRLHVHESFSGNAIPLGERLQFRFGAEAPLQAERLLRQRLQDHPQHVMDPLQQHMGGARDRQSERHPCLELLRGQIRQKRSTCPEEPRGETKKGKRRRDQRPVSRRRVVASSQLQLQTSQTPTRNRTVVEDLFQLPLGRRCQGTALAKEIMAMHDAEEALEALNADDAVVVNVIHSVKKLRPRRRLAVHDHRNRCQGIMQIHSLLQRAKRKRISDPKKNKTHKGCVAGARLAQHEVAARREAYLLMGASSCCFPF
eukprot:scaffold2730_cov247-Pinguiococcus_pyrenoidosus.AAC.3